MDATENPTPSQVRGARIVVGASAVMALVALVGAVLADGTARALLILAAGLLSTLALGGYYGPYLRGGLPPH